MTSRLAMAAAYVRTRALERLLGRRAAIERRQQRKLEALRRYAIAHTGFYRRLGDVPFADFPILSKADVMAQFAAFNALDLSAADAWNMVESGTAPAGYDVGCSSGTSGNRGLYVVSDRERFVWLGTILAKAVPDVLSRRHRVAVLLPRRSRLYEAANESRLLKLQFLDLGQGLPAITDALASFRPTIIVGPPKALRWLADHAPELRPERIFSSAEVLDPPDRQIIETAFGLTLGEIYMATEGLFGVSCRLG